LDPPGFACVVAFCLGAVHLATSQAPADVQFVNVATQSGVDFVHVNGASPNRHLYEIMSRAAGCCSTTTLMAGWTCSSWTVAHSPIRQSTRRHDIVCIANRGNGTFQDVTASSGHRAQRLRHGRVRGRRQ
jgi:hypothetical protein